MRPTPRQVAILLLLFPLMARAAPRGPYAEQLARECDALLDDAVRRPYGWGWDSATLAAASATNTPRHVQLEPPGTPGAALMLLWAGQLLDQPRYTQAAMEAARGVAASQVAAGKIPEHVIFGPTSTSSRDPSAAVPDRSGTRAALALFITVMQADPATPDAIHRSAQRAAQWMLRQQTEEGAWPSANVASDDPKNPDRIIRLDTTEYRDSTLLLLMAADAMDDPAVVRAANKAVARLISLRIRQPSPLNEPQNPDDAPEPDRQSDPTAAPNPGNLWNSAYRLDGKVDPDSKNFPLGADMLASRLALQTLIGGYLLMGERQTGLALDGSMTAAARLADPDGKWRRLYPSTPSTQPFVEDNSIFGPPTTQSSRITGTFELPRTLESARQLKLVGQERYRNMLAGQIGIQQQISATVCGLIDTPFSLDLPLIRSEVGPYLESHQALFNELKWDPPQDLSARVRRLWLLLLRARLELMQQS